jgi:hypothetical protein
VATRAGAAELQCTVNYSTCSLQIITNKIIAMQGQNSRVIMSSSGVVFTTCSLRHVYTVKSEYKQ